MVLKVRQKMRGMCGTRLHWTVSKSKSHLREAKLGFPKDVTERRADVRAL